MEWLNYHHLYYFWVVAREGSISRAIPIVRVAQPTISAQIKTLERSLGLDLFRREGRKLVLTDAGRAAYRYAEEIFSLGRELIDTLRDRPVPTMLRFEVGISPVLPKTLVEEILRPTLELEKDIRLVCREGRLPELLASLAVHDLDAVLSDQPADPSVKVKAHSHLLGECGISFLGSSRFSKLKRTFPRSLNGSPLLLPTAANVLRRDIDQWLDAHEIRPSVIAECDDSALLKTFGGRGLGIFPVPAVIGVTVCSSYDVRLIGHTEEVRHRVYAISIERVLRHPAVIALARVASERLAE